MSTFILECIIGLICLKNNAAQTLWGGKYAEMYNFFIKSK